MPYTKKRPFKGKRKYVPRKRYTRKAKPVFRQVRAYGVRPDPFPTRLHAKCKYFTDGVLTSHSSASNHVGVEKVFRLSSIYDPDFTGTGQTIVGWSTFNAIYSQYIVKGARVEITFTDPDIDGQTVFYSLNQHTALQSQSLSDAKQDSLTFSRVVNNTGSQQSTHKLYIKPWSLRGLSKLEWQANKSTHASAMATSPATDVYLRLGTSNSNASTFAHSIRYQLKIFYYVEFFDRKQLVPSSY